MTSAPLPFSGEARVCPHCKATILRTATVCPACHRYVRFDPVSRGRPASPSFCPLHVEGTVRHSGTGDSWEYSVVVHVQNDRGEVISRHVVGVGTLGPAEIRTFTVRVEVFTSQKAAV
jgi:hypothetical protein